ncbi:MAG: hypothetical protein WC059_03060 [Candidatus Paceibacterota bacterium]
MKKVMFLVMPMLALFFASCGGSSFNTVEKLVFPVTVDYSKSIEQYLREGECDYVDENISSTTLANDTKDTVISLEAVLVIFNRSMISEDVVAQLKLHGFRPGTARELYALGARYPRLQRGISIIALGSVTADSHVPVLVEFVHGGRDACLWPWSRGWNSEYWFLAFRD